MELIFLGTSSGTPTKTRNVSGLAVRRKNAKTWCLVDCGEGTQHQLLHTPLSLQQLELICITHVHGDHCYGLPGLLASAAMNGRTKKLQIIAPKDIKKMIDTVMTLSDSHLCFDIDFHDVNNVDTKALQCDFMLEVIKLSHRVPSYAYGFTDKSQVRKLNIERLKKDKVSAGPTWGLLQKGQDVQIRGKVHKAVDYLLPAAKPAKIIVGGDNDQPQLLAECAVDADVLVHEATYTHEMAQKIGPGPQHSCAQRVAQFAETIGLKNMVLTHFSARYQYNVEQSPSIADIEQEAHNHFSGNLYLANDFDVFKLNSNGDLEKCK